MNCSRCNKEFIPRSEEYKKDGLCSKCRSLLPSNLDKLRKTKLCPTCGKPILKTSVECNTCSQIGTKNHSWKEVKLDRGVYTTHEWKTWREQILVRDGRKCMKCGQTKGRLHAHHIIPKRTAPSLTYVLSNGITLCHKCHSEIQFKELDYVTEFQQLLYESWPNENSVNSVNPETGIPNLAEEEILLKV